MKIIKKSSFFFHSLFLLFWAAFFFLFLPSAYSQKSFDVHFDLKDFKIISEFEGITIKSSLQDSYFSFDCEDPYLPLVPIRVIIPSNLDSVIYNYTFEEEILQINATLNNVPIPMTTNGKRMNRNPLKVNSILAPIKNSRIVNYGNYKYYYLEISPFLYNSENKTLSFVKDIKLFFPDLPNIENLSLSESTLNKIPNRLNGAINQNDIQSYYPNLTTAEEYSDPVDYLIITCDSLVQSFQTLKEWKMRKGLRTRIIDIESIDINYSNSLYNYDRQVRIKSCIKDYYENHGTKWVLLGGDDTIIPTRYQPIYDENEIVRATPTDLFFGCLEGSFDWVANFGMLHSYIDPNMNLNPSVYVSRLPIRNSEHVYNYTNKLLKYEKYMPSNIFYDCVFLSGYSDTSIGFQNAKYYNDLIFQNYVSPYWNGNKYYYYSLTDNFFPPNIDEYYGIQNFDMILEILRGYNLVHVVSHGAYNYWDLGPNGNLGYYDISFSECAVPSIYVTNACFTNNFLEEECLSEMLLRQENGGAIAYFGCSKEGWGGENGAIDHSFEYDGLFFKNLFKWEPYNAPFSFVAVAAKAKSDMIEKAGGFGIDRWLQFGINPMGDPEMQIHTDSVHSFVTFNLNQAIEPTILVNFTNVGIIISSTVDSCKIVLVDENENIYKADNVSTASFTGLSGECKISILKHNYRPYLYTVSLGGLPPSPPGPVFLQIHNNTGHLNISLYNYISDNGYHCVNSSCSDEVNYWKLSIINSITRKVMYNGIVEKKPLLKQQLGNQGFISLKP